MAFDLKENLNAFLLEVTVKVKRNDGKIAKPPIEFKERVYTKSKMALGQQAANFFIKAISYPLDLS